MRTCKPCSAQSAQLSRVKIALDSTHQQFSEVKTTLEDQIHQKMELFHARDDAGVVKSSDWGA